MSKIILGKYSEIRKFVTLYYVRIFLQRSAPPLSLSLYIYIYMYNLYTRVVNFINLTFRSRFLLELYISMYYETF
jgi:hypothetical protein